MHSPVGHAVNRLAHAALTQDLALAGSLLQVSVVPANVLIR